jgi:4-diphosphocytidyl-2-C-methyl-D-erythritol kinase
LRKREDGFHDLASLFQAVGFGDTLELTPLDRPSSDEKDENAAEPRTDVFTCNMEGVPTDSRNLVIRALELMRQKTGIDQHYRANLVKQVPAQAGLGGGSANAATAMWGANELMGRPASLDEVRLACPKGVLVHQADNGQQLDRVPYPCLQMVEWSAELGSDITFFLSRGTAYCTGRGEVMSSIDPPLPSGTRLCIVKPDIGLSTPSVFKALDYDELSPLDADDVLLPTFLSTNPIDEVPADCFVNDLEPPAFRCVPELKELKDELLQVPGFKRVMMSGSGTSIFCLGEPSDADSFRDKFVSRDGLQVFFTEFISRPEGSWFERPTQSQ